MKNILIRKGETYKDALNKLRYKYGSAEFLGEEFILVEDPYMDNGWGWIEEIGKTGSKAVWHAQAIRPKDRVEEFDGCSFLPLYEVEWLPVFDEYSEPYDWEILDDVVDYHRPHDYIEIIEE